MHLQTTRGTGLAVPLLLTSEVVLVSSCAASSIRFADLCQSRRPLSSTVTSVSSTQFRRPRPCTRPSTGRKHRLAGGKPVCLEQGTSNLHATRLLRRQPHQRRRRVLVALHPARLVRQVLHPDPVSHPREHGPAIPYPHLVSALWILPSRFRPHLRLAANPTPPQAILPPCAKLRAWPVPAIADPPRPLQ